MNAVNPRVPRHSEPKPVAEAPAPVRTSEAIEVDIDGLRAERDQAKAALADLEAGQDNAILAGETVAEQHELEIARQRRALRRIELQLSPLRAELAEAESREEETRQAEQRAAAETAIAALLADLEKHYAGPARNIAVYLERWRAVDAQASAAGILGPGVREVHHPEVIIVPEKTQVVSFFRDEQGNPSREEHPIGDDGKRDKTKFRQRVTETVVVEKAQVQRAKTERLFPPVRLVRLPGLDGSEGFWPPPSPPGAAS